MDELGSAPRVLLADKGCDPDLILAAREARAAAACPSVKRNRKVQPVTDGSIYGLRNLVERSFSKLKFDPRLANRYDKTDDSFSGSPRPLTTVVRHVVSPPTLARTGTQWDTLARTVISNFNDIGSLLSHCPTW
jgi:hypothetical protein